MKTAISSNKPYKQDKTKCGQKLLRANHLVSIRHLHENDQMPSTPHWNYQLLTVAVDKYIVILLQMLSKQLYKNLCPDF
jgi:hypothetical protein